MFEVYVEISSELFMNLLKYCMNGQGGFEVKYQKDAVLNGDFTVFHVAEYKVN